MEMLVDTNVLVYATVEDSEFHEECVKKLEEAERIHLISTVVEEFVLVLKSIGIAEDFIKDQARTIITDPRVNFITLKLKDLEDALKILKKEKVSVREFNDKLILTVAKRKGLQVYSYDKSLRNECQKFKVRVLP